jgi:hypothetical protein
MTGEPMAEATKKEAVTLQELTVSTLAMTVLKRALDSSRRTSI